MSADTDYTASPLRGSFANRTAEQTEKYYDDWAETYDKDTAAHHYNGPKYLGELCLKYIPKETLILCIGAGTGLEAEELHRIGYAELDGHDGSQKMLDIAKEKAIFRNYFCQLFHPNEKSVFKDESYAAQVCVGCFVPGQLNALHFNDLMRSLKPKGIFIIGTRKRFVTPAPDFEYNYDLEKTIKAHKDVELLEEREFANYSEGWPAQFYVIKKK